MFKSKCGIIYKGKFENGLKHGRGVYECNEYQYEGEFWEDLKNGQGIQRFYNGTIFEGNFSNDKKQGKGKLISGNT